MYWGERSETVCNETIEVYHFHAGNSYGKLMKNKKILLILFIIAIIIPYTSLSFSMLHVKVSWIIQ